MNNNCTNCGKLLDHTYKLLCTNCGRYPLIQDLWKTIEQIIPLMINLNNKINELKKFIIQNKITITDQKAQTIGSLGYITLWTIIQLKLFTPNFKTNTSPVPIYLNSINNFSEKSMTDIIANFDLMNRISFMTMFIFQIDIFLRSINSILENKNNEKGYKSLVKHILKELKIPNNNNEKYHILYIPAMIRNSLHTDGAYTEEDDNGRVENILFKFKKGESHAYGTWFHEYFFCDKMLDVVKEILNHPTIIKTSLPIFKDSSFTT